MKCPNCHATIEHNWLICPSCGSDISPLQDNLSSFIPLELRVAKERELQSYTNSSIPSVNQLNGNKLNNNKFFIIKMVLLFIFIMITFFVALISGSGLLKTATSNNTYKSTLTRTPSPTNTPKLVKTSTPNPSPTYPPMPNFIIRSFDQGKDENLMAFWSEDFIPDFSWPTIPGEYFWELTYLSDTPIMIYDGWCALDSKILDQNLAQMKFIFVLDGLDITDSLEISDGTAQMFDKEWVCNNYTGVVENLNKGKHNVVYSHIILQFLNDGLDNYSKGDYIYNFTINIP